MFSDRKNNAKNEKFRQFAIGAMYHFSFWDGLDEKLWLAKVRKVVEWERITQLMFFEVYHCTSRRQ